MTTHAQGLPTTAPEYPAPAPPAEPPGPAPAIRTAAASRRTNRKLLILSVLIVLVGGVVGLTAGKVLTHHAEVLAVARPVAMGAVITDVDLTVANVPQDPHLSPIPAAERARIVGMTAQVALSTGEMLTRAQVGAGDGFARGQMLVALALKQGQFPGRGLTAGQRVLIVATPGTTGGASPGGALAGTPTSSGAGGDQGIQATVTELEPTNQATMLTVVDVRVRAQDGVAAARLASTGNLALILLPAGR